MRRGTLILIVAILGTVVLFGQVKTKTKVLHPEWSRNATIYEVNLRQYSNEGTFEAFAEYLPELKKMGVKILWFMPIHPIGEVNRKGSLGSYYAVKDYKAVNPEFGSPEDFKKLVEKIHSLGMFVIIDWVANHTAWDNVWVKSHPEFYNKDENGNFYPPIEGWQDVIDLNYKNKKLWSAMIDAMKYWVEEFDIDGYRCDVAAMVPTEFWNKARSELDKLKPVFMLAEAIEPELHEYAFDMTYNWQLKDMMNDIAAKKKNVMDLIELIEKEREIYPADAYRMNFTTNHDENSWDGTVFERLGDGAAVFAVLAATLDGMPLVYSGQEAGLNKRLDFFEKDPIVWQPHPFAQMYEKLLNLNLNNRALWNGNSGGGVEIIESATDDYVISFVREKDRNKVFAVINLSDKPRQVYVESDLINGKFTELFSGNKKSFSKKTRFNLEPWGYFVFFK